MSAETLKPLAAQALITVGDRSDGRCPAGLRSPPVAMCMQVLQLQREGEVLPLTAAADGVWHTRTMPSVPRNPDVKWH